MKNYAIELFDFQANDLPKNLNALSSDFDRSVKDRKLKITALAFETETEQNSVYIVEDPKELIQHAHQLKLASLGRFTVSVAHEIRNPLGAIPHAGQLLTDKDLLSPHQTRLVEIININFYRMNLLINNILLLSRQERSQPTAIILYDFLQEFIREYPAMHNVHFVNKLKDSEIQVLFYPSQLNQLLVIVANNSL